MFCRFDESDNRTGHGNGSTAFPQNGLNQQLTVGGAAASWDARGNLTNEPQSGKTYGYTSENLLTSATGGVTLAYDPALRLYQVAGAATTRFLYDGPDAIAEYNGSNALQRRFVFDPTTGQPVLWYEGTGTAATNRRYLSADERGSVISVSDSTGASLGLNTYSEYGKPGTGNLGRYQYTGQKWIGEANIYDYKARDYVAQLGIFAQTDPVGTGGGINLYGYTGDDPVNATDPLGLNSVVIYGDGIYGICKVTDSGVICMWYPNPGNGPVILGTRPDPGCAGVTLCISDPNVVGTQPLRQPSSGSGVVGGTASRSSKPSPSRYRSQCAAGSVGAGVAGILGIGVEGPLALGTFGEVAVGGLAIAAAPELAIGLIVVGVVSTVAVGTYYSDQSNNNGIANGLRKNFGIC